MGSISPVNQLQFRPSNELFARIKKFLSSFDAAGQIDEGDFYHYIKDCIAEVGIYYYQEQEAVLSVKDYKTILPQNFYQLYAAYHCLVSENSDKIDKSCIGEHISRCEIMREQAEGSFAITVESYINGNSCKTRFHSPTLLTLSSHVKPKFFASDCLNISARGVNEITIDEGMIYTNFSKAAIYLQYYGFPADLLTGLPLIPEDTHIEKTLEYYIMFKTLETLWLNNQAPDIETRLKYLHGQYNFHLAKAKYNAKLPSFQTMIAHIKERRGRFDIYNQLTNRSNGWYFHE